MAEIRIEQVSPELLAPAQYNPRKMSESARNALKRGIGAFGLVDPIIARRSDNLVIGGHQRLTAAKELGLASVPVVYLDDLDDQKAAALNVLLNNPSAQGEWDFGLLSGLLSDLDANGFDATLTGFSDSELEALLSWAPEPELAGEEGDVDLTPPEEPESVLGEVYHLGRHRLMCGNSTDPLHVDKLLGGVAPDVAYNDPPYGISIVQGGWVGGGEANNIPFGGVPKGETETQKRRRLGTANGSKPFGSREVNRYASVIGDDSTDTAVAAYNLCAGMGIPVLVFWGGNYYADSLPASSCWIVWDKENTGNFADAELAWTNQKTAVRIFRHMWNGMVKASERGERRVHPTQKPVALAEWCLSQYGKAGDAVLDLFGGSGSTLIAAERTNRTAYLMEMSPAYCDVIRRRYEALTGNKAVAA
jgi:hypothetical protein